MVWLGESPINAAPTGVRTEILPALMSAFSGRTSCNGDQLLCLGRQRAIGENLLAECLKCTVYLGGKPLARIG